MSSYHLLLFPFTPKTPSFFSFKNPKPQFLPFSLSSPQTSFPFSHFHRPLPKNPPIHKIPDTDETLTLDADVVIGDCLVFDSAAFDDESALNDPPIPPKAPSFPRNPQKAPPLAKIPVQEENLVPEKWKQAVEELNLTKKEKRRISHQLRFGQKMEHRKVSPIPDMEEYRNYRERKLAELKPVVLDNPPPEFLKPLEEVVKAKESEVVLSAGRVVPRNPKSGLAKATVEDVSEFFSSGEYVPGEVYEEKVSRGRRKLFSQEEKVLLNRRIPNLDEATSSKWLPLQSLAASGELYLLDSILKHNVDINAVNKDGLTALHKAILSKKQALVNYLLRNSADPFVRDKDGATLMHYAVQTASLPTIKILLLYNVDINLADDDGWTPLHLAVQTQRTDIVRLLLIKGADKTLKNQDGLTALDLCLYSGHGIRTCELIKLLKRR